MKSDNLAMFIFLEISLLFAIDFETFGKLSFWTNRNSICSACRTSPLLWGVPSASFWTSCRQWSSWLRLKLLYRLQSNSWSSFVSVATVRVTCSGSSSFFWHHGCGQSSSLRCSHAAPFSHTEFSRPSIDIPRVPMSAGFSTPLTCHHWSINEFSSISAALFATNTCFLCAVCCHCSTVDESVQCKSYSILTYWSLSICFLRRTP